jgi:hypothetical protein
MIVFADLPAVVRPKFKVARPNVTMDVQSVGLPPGRPDEFAFPLGAQAVIALLNNAGSNRRRAAGSGGLLVLELFFNCSSGINGLFLTQPPYVEFAANGSSGCRDAGLVGPEAGVDEGKCLYIMTVEDNGFGDQNPLINQVTVYFALSVKNDSSAPTCAALEAPSSSTAEPAVLDPSLLESTSSASFGTFVGVLIPCLASILLLFTVFRSKSLRRIVVAQLVIHLLIASTMLMLGLASLKAQGSSCKAAIVVLHFCALAALAFSFADAYLLSIKITKMNVTWTQKHVAEIMALCYGTPLLVVALVAGLQGDDYCSPATCWPSNQPGVCVCVCVCV